MKDYTTENPSFSESVTLLETTDTNHADNFNRATMQLFENTMSNKKLIEKQEKEKHQMSDDETGAVYKMGVENGLIYLEEVEKEEGLNE